MFRYRHSETRLSRTFIIIGALAPALLGADAAISAASAQKAEFERTKPHVNVGTIGDQEEGPTGFATTTSQAPAKCCGNMIVDGVRSFKRTPRHRVQIRTRRARPQRR